jgi:hypothetical protein
MPLLLTMNSQTQTQTPESFVTCFDEVVTLTTSVVDSVAAPRSEDSRASRVSHLSLFRQDQDGSDEIPSPGTPMCPKALDDSFMTPSNSLAKKVRFSSADNVCVFSMETKPSISYPQLSRAARKQMSPRERADFAVVNTVPKPYGVSIYRNAQLAHESGGRIQVRSYKEQDFVTDLKELGSLLKSQTYVGSTNFFTLADFIWCKNNGFLHDVPNVCLVDCIRIDVRRVVPLNFTKFDSLNESLRKQLELRADARTLSSVTEKVSALLLGVRDVRVVSPQMFGSASAAMKEVPAIRQEISEFRTMLTGMFQKEVPDMGMEVGAMIIDIFNIMQMVSESLDGNMSWKYVVASATSLFLRIAAARGLVKEFSNFSITGILETIKKILEIGKASLDSALGAVADKIRVVRPQNDLLPSLWSEMTTSLARITGMFIFGVTSTAKGGLSKFHSLANVGRDINSLVSASKNVWTMVAEFAKYLPDCMKEWVDYLFPSVAWVTSEVGKEFEEWVRKVYEFTEVSNAYVTMANRANMKVAEDLFAKGLSFAEAMAKVEKVSPLLVGQYRTCFDLIAKFRSALVTRFASGVRAEPFHISIYGPPRVGKSRVAEAFAEVMTPTHMDVPLGEPFELTHTARFYSMTPGMQTMDAYARQHTVLIDDLSQLTDGKDAVTLMRCVGKTQYQIEQASLDDPSIGVKGTCFDSKLIISTTNDSHPRPTTVAAVDAMWGRRHKLVECRAKEGFRGPKGALNMERVNEGAVRRSEHLEWIYLDPRNPFHVKDWSHPLSTIQMMKELSEAFKTHQAFEDAVMDVDRDYFLQAIKDCPARVVQPQMFALLRRFQRPEPRARYTLLDEYINDCLMGAEADGHAGVHCLTSQTETYGDVSWTVWGREAILAHYRSHCPDYDGELERFGNADVVVVDSSGKEIYTLPMMEQQAACLWVGHGGLIDGHASPLIGRFSIKNLVHNMIMASHDFDKKYGHILTGILSVCRILTFSTMALCGIYKIVREDKKKPFVDGVLAVAQMANPSNGEITQVKRPVRNFSAIVKNIADNRQARQVAPQHSISPTSDVPAKVHQNMGRLTLSWQDEAGPHYGEACCFGIANGIFLTVSHMFLNVPDGAKMSIVRSTNVKYDLIFKRDDMFLFPHWEADAVQKAVATLSGSNLPLTLEQIFAHRDLVAYRVPQCMMPFYADVTTHFIDPTVLDHLTGRPGFMLSRTLRGDLSTFVLPQVQMSTKMSLDTVDGKTYHVIPRGLEYHVNVGDGTCGSVLILDREGPCVAGIHYAYEDCTGFGISEIVTQAEIELLREIGWLKNVRVHADPVGENTRLVSTQFRSITESDSRWFHTDHLDMEPVGIMNDTCRFPQKHAFRPSLLFGKIFVPTTDNSVLSPSDPRLGPEYIGLSPIKRAHAKYGHATGPFDPDIINATVGFLAEMFKPMAGSVKRVLTYDEAINGIPEAAYFERLNMQTAAGFDWSQPGSRGKRHLFTEADGNYTMIPRLQEACESYWNRLDNYELGGHIWKATMKTERRPVDKIVKGKTRHFSIAQVFRVIVSRRLNLAFNANFLARCNTSYSAAGVNPYSKQWDRFANYLLEVSPDIFDIDYEGFDGHCAREMLFIGPQVRNRWYEDQFSHMRDNMMEEEIFRYEVVGNAVYQMSCGNPSGDDGTTVMNTLIGIAYLYYTFMVSVPLPMASEEVFLAHVHAKLLGDDNVVALSKEVQPYFNPAVLQRTLAEYGVVITSVSTAGQAGKSDDVVMSTIDQVTFLKCGFRFAPELGDVFVPTMAKNTIQELTNWISSELPDSFDATLENCNTALRFAVFYGPDYFSDLRSKISAALTLVAPNERSFWLLTYDDLRRSFINENLWYFPNMTPTTRAKPLSGIIV